MPASTPAPCKIQRGTGTVYFWDGVHAMTELFGGVGNDLNSIDGTLTVHVLTTSQWDNLQTYLLARDAVFAQQIANAVNNPSPPAPLTTAELNDAIEAHLT